MRHPNPVLAGGSDVASDFMLDASGEGLADAIAGYGRAASSDTASSNASTGTGMADVLGGNFGYGGLGSVAGGTSGDGFGGNRPDGVQPEYRDGRQCAWQYRRHDDRRPPVEAETKPAPSPVNPFHSPYDLGRFDPGISYAVRQAPAAEKDSAQSAGFAQSDLPLSGIPLPDPGPSHILPLRPEGGGLSFDGTLYIPDGTIQLPLPGSVMTLTVQTLTLEDDDLVTFGPSAGFVAPAVYHAQLTALAEVGAALHAEGRLETIAALAGSSEQIMAAARALTTLAEPQLDIASASSHRVDGAGVTIFSDSNTFLGTGENLLSNATSISDHGMQLVCASVTIRPSLARIAASFCCWTKNSR